MEPSCIRQDLIPGTTRLFSSYLYNFPEVNSFYPAGPPDVEQVVGSARQISFSDERRSGIVSALREQNEDSAVLEKLALPGTVAVVSGQQVGLFSGPAYTIFKALTAVKLARHLDAQGIAAVPVFWLATEDHDLAEVNHAWLFDDHGTPSRVAQTMVASGGPVGATSLGDISLTELKHALGSLPFVDEVMARLSSAYRPNQTLGSAFATFLKELLGGFGLLFLDPLRPAIRKLAAPFLVEAARQAPELVAKLRQRSSDLEAAGFHAQVLVEKDASLLFLLSGNKRLALRTKDGKFVSREGELNAGDIADLGLRLSPNALLRPVLQDFLLPTVAYVAGPAEIAYFAQSSILYQALLGRMPVIFPRNSFTLLDARAEKLMNVNHLRLPDLLDYQESVKAKIASRMLPTNLAADFSQIEKTISSALSKLRSDLAHFDPTLQPAAEKSTAKMLYQLKKLQAKTARETLRRDEKASADAAYLMNLVFPNKHLQERLYSIVPFLAKYGLDFPQSLYAQTQLTCCDHMVRSF